MSVLDKKLLIDDLKAKLDDYVPANMVARITSDLGEIFCQYEVTTLKPDDGDDESEQLIRMYLDALTIEGKSENTINRYEYIINRLRKDIDVPVRRITIYHIRQYLMAEKNRGISMSTIKSSCYVYSGFFGWLHKEGIIETNPTSNLGNIKAKPEEQLPFNAEEIQLIKETCATDLQTAIVHFLLSTGCRVSEMCSVNRQDIDWRNLRLQVTGKGNKTRTVYIDDVTSLMLKRYLATRKDIDPALFYNTKNHRITPHCVRQMLKVVERKSHVPNIHPHRFRHTLATNLIDRGMDIQEVASILGHSKLDTTMTYITINERNAENSYRRFACM